MKRSILRLRRISGKQLNILYRISHGEFKLIEPEMLPFFRDIHDHLTRITDLAENYRDLIGGALDSYLSVVSNRTNDIMKVLTIFSAIMLPLTFIAGLYGMNFDNLPELHYEYSYFIVLAIMVVVAIGMLIFFWRKGWIGSGPRRDEGGGMRDESKDEGVKDARMKEKLFNLNAFLFILHPSVPHSLHRAGVFAWVRLRSSSNAPSGEGAVDCRCFPLLALRTGDLLFLFHIAQSLAARRVRLWVFAFRACRCRR